MNECETVELSDVPLLQAESLKPAALARATPAAALAVALTLGGGAQRVVLALAVRSESAVPLLDQALGCALTRTDPH